MGTEVYHHLAKIIKAKYGIDATNVGDEGGFAPSVREVDSLEMLKESIFNAGHEGKIQIGLDCAAAEFYLPEKNSYDLDFKNPSNDGSRVLSAEKLVSFYTELVDKYGIVSIEDPFDQDDFAGYGIMTKNLGERVQIVGDDLLVTNKLRV